MKVSRLLMITVLLATTWQGAAASIVPNPKERIEYWRKNYKELTAEQDPRVSKAREIFTRVLNAAGSRHGVHPRLHIIAQDPLNITLPISIPDGWVVLSKGVLELCYKDGHDGDDRLAFVMAHEIAHLLDDDFWHINFFNAIELSKRKGLADEFVLNQIRGIVGETNKVQAKELRADEKGILFASMAGFNTDAIVNVSGDTGFFAQWESLLNPHRVKQRRPRSLNNVKAENSTHPSSVQRNTAIITRLRQVSAQAELFDLGLLFYQMGDFERAIDAFGEFQRHYPGREVHHNLAVSHHQQALKLLSGINDSPAAQFKLALAVDPVTRAAQTSFRGPEHNEFQFKQHMAVATEYYRTAIKQDPTYILAYKNLGSAYIVNDEPFKAIAILKDALKQAPDNSGLLNAMGVAFHFSENSLKAQDYLRRAMSQSSGFADPLYNLGMMAYLGNNMEAARRYWKQYLELDSNSNWAKTLRSRYKVDTQLAVSRGLISVKNEMLSGLQVGHYADEIPRSWGKGAVKLVSFKDAPFTTSEYGNGITTLAEGDEIRAVLAGLDYGGASNRGIKIGVSQEQVLSAYGVPSSTLNTTLGASWVYAKERITFQIRDNSVVSWVIF
ncbi:MAG: M48 family metalloprotease [Gammaproteobacteria bacterium]|nr:M48 family metalloprotease [Gammaproteobacteria bacterium]MDH5799933.1 M48 family metalloprotease [Gammaproteobacteria bacterium]